MELKFAEDRFRETAAVIARVSPRKLRPRFKISQLVTQRRPTHRVRISVARDFLLDRHPWSGAVEDLEGTNLTGLFGRAD